MPKNAPKKRAKVEYDSKELVEMIKGGANNKDIMDKLGFKSASQIKVAYVNAAMELGMIPKVADSRAVSTPDKETTVNKRGSLIIPKKIVDELGFKENDAFTVKKNKAGISMNCPAASRGVSFKGFCRFYRSKLRGIRP
jgi:bifunctional DNA-binding transcriptional regulator/antitoxin component of YhaV-PrlF toxin-antitoxin module